jgi:c-di-GMP-binding flagellar brake protein YcgR
MSKSKRRFYRQAQTLKGVLRYEGLTYNFTTADTSALGMMVYVIGPVGFKKKEKVTFEIQEKRMTGMGEVVWLHYDNDKNSAIMGLKFSTLSNS